MAVVEADALPDGAARETFSQIEHFGSAQGALLPGHASTCFDYAVIAINLMLDHGRHADSLPGEGRVS